MHKMKVKLLQRIYQYIRIYWFQVSYYAKEFMSSTIAYMKAYHQGQLDFFCGLYAFINCLKLIGGLNLEAARQVFAQALLEISAHPIPWQALLDNDSDYYWLMRYLFGRFGHKPGAAFTIGQLPLALMDGKERRATCPERQAQFGTYGVAETEMRALLDLKRPEEIKLEELERGHMYLRPLRSAERTERENNWSMDGLWPLLQSWLPAGNLFNKFTGDGEQRTGLILRFHRYLYPGQPPVVSHWTSGLEFKGDTLHLFDCTADSTAVHRLAPHECVLSASALSPERLIRIEPESIYFLERI
jgi:hypothetical protein